MVFSDTYLQPGAPDPVLNERAVVAAAARHSADVARVLEIDESGGEARAYLLDGGVVVKTQRPHRLRPRTSLSKEAFVLQELERVGGFPVPQLLGHGEMEGIEYLAMTRIPGVASCHLRLEPRPRAAMLVGLGEVLRSLHGIEQSRLRECGLVPGDESPVDLRARLGEAFARLGKALEGDSTWREDLDIGRLAAGIDALPVTTEPVTLHSNPGPEHVFVDPQTGRFTGVIDFGDAYRSHPALDFRPWYRPADSAELRRAYRSAGPLPGGFEQVLATCLVMAELARVARGSQDSRSAARRIRELISP